MTLEGLDLRRVLMDILVRRVSVRRYKPDPISDEQIRLLCEAAGRAPSGENFQPWRFIVVRDPAVRKILGDIGQAGSGRRFTAEFVTHKMQERFAEVTDPAKRAHIFRSLVTGNVSRFIGDAPANIVVLGHRGSWDLLYDVSCAIENMMLMATAMGLGSCWVAAASTDIRDEKKLAAMFQVPRDYKIVAVVSLGYPERVPRPRPRRSVEENVFRETYGMPFFTTAGAAPGAEMDGVGGKQ